MFDLRVCPLSCTHYSCCSAWGLVDHELLGYDYIVYSLVQNMLHVGDVCLMQRSNTRLKSLWKVEDTLKIN